MKTRFERFAELKLLSPQELDVAFVGVIGALPRTPTFMLTETQLWVRRMAIINMEASHKQIHNYDFLCRSCSRPCSSQDIEAGPSYAAYEMFSKHHLCLPCASALLSWPEMKSILQVLIDQALSAGALPSK